MLMRGCGKCFICKDRIARIEGRRGTMGYLPNRASALGSGSPRHALEFRGLRRANDERRRQ